MERRCIILLFMLCLSEGILCINNIVEELKIPTNLTTPREDEEIKLVEMESNSTDLSQLKSKPSQFELKQSDVESNASLVELNSSHRESKSSKLKSKSLKEILKASEYRLPKSLSPIHYLVRLQPFVNGNFSFNGFVEITFDVLKPTNQITLHIKDIITLNDTTKVYAVKEKNTTLRIVSQKYDNIREFYVATLSEELIQGETYIIEMNFIGYLNSKLDGFYRSSYLDEAGNKRWLAATQFQPTDGRMAFPMFDEPALKAEFSIEIIRQSNMSSISNMPKIESLPVLDQPGWILDRFEKSVKMSTYLVAFMVSDLKSIQTPVHSGTSMKVWAREAAIHQAMYGLEKGKEVLLFFEDYFNITFPLPKTDMVALPDFSAGAMENWGLVNYRETLLIYDPKSSTARTKYVVGSIISHELAHQWFGNLVTPNWWNDLWLNEGFATWMAAVCHNVIEPEMKVMDQFVFTVTSALLADSLENSHPISNPVGNPEDIAEIFDAISYSKGASLLRMINHFLTENTFKKGVSNYLRKYAYSDAEQDHLWQYLTDQAVLDKTLPINVTVKEIMDTWTLQMGFPVVTVVINADGTATLTQERFLKYKKQNISDFSEYKWWIPITYSFESNPDFTKTNPKEWMSPSETTKVISGLPSKDQWFVFNNILAGFYRVNYELDNWQRIIKQFNIDHKVFPTITRAQLIGDAFQLARGGLLDYTIPLSLILYLKREKELVPLKTAISASSFLRSTMKYTEYEDLINNFTLALLAPHYDKYGFKISPTDTYMDKSIRSALLYVVCRLDYEPCINNAVELYQEWMNDPTNESIIAPNIQSLVYCIGIKKGGQREWDFAWEQYRHLKLVSQKEYILSALGCTLNETLRLEYLNIMFKKDSPVRKQNVGRSFGSICRDKEGHILAWNYLRQNWNKISEHLGSKLKMIGFIRAASGFVKNYKQLAEVDNFIESREDLEGVGTRSLEQMRENIVGSIKWLEENLELVGQWLLKQEVDRSVKT